MPALRFTGAGFGHDRAYRGPSGSWGVGDVREVDADEAERLERDFPAAFVAEPVAAVLPEPPADRAVPSPTRAKRGR